MHTRQKFEVAIVGALLAASLVPGAHAATVKWRPPVAKHLSFSPGTGVAGKPVKITCAFGANQELQIDTNTAQGKYLASGRKPSWTLPAEILVNNVPIGKWDLPGLAGLGSTWTRSANWTPGPAHAGQSIQVQCVVDKDQKIFYSTKAGNLNVVNPVPRVDMKDQKPQNAIQIPGGPKLPSPPSR
jgi:hypothetical protein